MIRRMFKKNKIKNANFFVEPDEIFLDSKNLQNFDQQQFEGRIEKTISKKNILLLGVFFFLFSVAFIGRLGYLQIQKGEAYFKRSENNTLEKEIIFADRGIIYDRFGVELAWNNKNTENISLIPTDDGVENKINDQGVNFSTREYLSPGFAHVLGYVSGPAQDKSGKYWQTEFIGKEGLEKIYNEFLTGKNGAKIIEVDAHRDVHSENIVNVPVRGGELYTTLDSRIQSQLFKLMKNLADTSSFTGAGAVVMDIHNGEILVSSSFPEYDSNVLSFGKNVNLINSYLNDKRKVFLDRNVSGLYTPGSIVKPFFALAALTEGIIKPEKEIFSSGELVYPNPYDKSKPTIFKDWKAHGWTSMREAIAVSSDVYFYTIGGGFEGQKGLGITNLEKYAKLFGIGVKTGVDLPNEKSGIIPNPEWKLKNFAGEPWRIGNTFHTAIGQYGFQVTPLEMVRATASLANYGTLVTPHFVLNDIEKKENNIKIEGLKKEHYDVIHEGMREAVSYGTAVALNVPYVKVAAKTGTAQVGISKSKINSWIIGFFPYENPKYAFTVMMEGGPASGTVGASSIMRGLFDWMSIHTPEYFK